MKCSALLKPVRKHLQTFKKGVCMRILHFPPHLLGQQNFAAVLVQVGEETDFGTIIRPQRYLEQVEKHKGLHSFHVHYLHFMAVADGNAGLFKSCFIRGWGFLIVFS